VKDVMREEKNENGAVSAARARLCHNIGSRARFGGLHKIKETRFRRPLPYNFRGGVIRHAFSDAFS
jgi:hypothetical protein